MPFRLHTHWRWSFATRQPWARRWARATLSGAGWRVRRLPERKALLDADGADAPRAPAATRQAQQIRGNLYRGERGQFQAGPGTILQQRMDAARQLRRRRASARADESTPPAPAGADAIADYLHRLGLQPDLADALAEYLSGQIAEPPEDLALNREAAQALADRGLIAIAEGQADDAPTVRVTLTGQGRQVLRAMQQRADARAARILERGRERAERAAQRRADQERRRAERDQRQAARAQARQRTAAEQEQREAEQRRRGRSGGGGGGGAARLTPEERDQLRQAERERRGRETAQRVGLGVQDYADLSIAAEGGAAPTNQALRALGLLDEQGVITSHGLSALRALERGDTRGYVAARGRAERANARTEQRHARRIAEAARADPGRLSLIEQRRLVRHGLARYDAAGNMVIIMPEGSPMSDSDAVKGEQYGGVERAELADADFVDPERRAFPIMTRQDVRDAISSWGRYRGSLTFAAFKRRLIRLAKRKGLDDALPAAWREEMEGKAIDLATLARMVEAAISEALSDLDSIEREPGDDLDMLALATLARPALEEWRASPAYAEGDDPPIWVYPDDAVVMLRPGMSWRVPYALEEGDIVVSTPDQWERVAMTWEPVPADAPAEAGAIKVSNDGATVIAQAIRFGAPDDHDLSPHNDFFTKSTDFWLDHWRVRPMLYHHAQDPGTAADPVIGWWTKAWTDDIGVWLEGQLNVAHRYYAAITELIRRGLLRISTDSAPHLVIREPRGAAQEVKRWPIIAASLTPAPAEPRLLPADLKSLLASCGLDAWAPHEALDPDPGEARHAAEAGSDEAQRLAIELDILHLEADV